MTDRLISLGAGLVSIGVAALAWRLRSSTRDAYQAMWRALGGRADSPAAVAQQAVGTYGVIVLSATVGVVLVVSAALR